MKKYTKMELDTLDLGLHSWPAVEEPDFTYGVKAASSLLPATSVFNYNDATTDMPEWMETRDILGWDQLNPFEEVILPENQSFGPDDLFKDLPPAKQVLPQEFEPAVTTDSKQNMVCLDYTTSVNSMPSEPAKIVICVKRVTIPTSTRKVCNKFTSVSYTGNIQENILQPQVCQALPSNAQETKQQQNRRKILRPSSPLMTVPQSLLSPSPLGNFSTINREDITLKEALNLNDADIVLDQLLNLVEENSNSISSEPDIDTLSDVSSWDSEPCSPASSIESSSFFKDKYLEDLTYTNQFETVLQPTSSLPSIDKTEVKPRKQGRKSCGSSSRAEPYLTNKRERKREQNKQAATRYRQKKKKEEDEITNSLKEEEDHQKKLTEKYNGLKQELTYLKKIMREVFIAKGVLSADAFKRSKIR